MKKIKIICTLGPKTETKYMIEKLVNNGMNIARLNFSHGGHCEQMKRIKNIHYISMKTNKEISILLDTKGPEIRTKNLENNKEVLLKKNQIFTLLINSNIKGNKDFVSITEINSVSKIKIGDLILIDDGMLIMKIINLHDNKIVCKNLYNGILGEKKGIYIPRIVNNSCFLSEKDKEDIIFGFNNKIDFLAISFVRNQFDIIEVRNFLNKLNSNIKIISKIENKDALNNINEIIKISDGIMIARGDLGIQTPIDEIIFKQKMIIKKCNSLNKPVITATQMLNSMIKFPRPTRSEISDIVNSILDGTDIVMLSGETANGDYPIESLKMMNSVCNKTDSYINNINNKNKSSKIDKKESIFSNIVNISNNINTKFIVVLTEDHLFINLMRKFSPKSYILSLTSNLCIQKKLILIKGVLSYKIDKINSKCEFYKNIKDIIKKYNLANDNDILITLYGLGFNCINNMSIIKYKDL